MTAKRIKFGSLNVGELFNMENKTWIKTNFIDMGSCKYNARTEKVNFCGCYIRLIPDHWFVTPTPEASFEDLRK